jgi:myo-inositol-1(or 4)-monophosphatase
LSSNPLVDLAVEGAHRAGGLLLERFSQAPTGVESKSSPTDLVSDADRDSESLLLELIASRRPEDSVLAEESGGDLSPRGLTWIVDPLDGTVNFLFRIPVWAVSVAVADPEGLLVGVVYDPNRDETFTAARGQGTRLNSEPVRVSDRSKLAEALVGTGFAYDAPRRAAQAEVAARLLPKIRDIRRAGSAALDLAWVACGRLDAFYEAHMGRWDRAAGELLVREAGGVVSELRDPIGADHGVVAGPEALHDRLRSLVA